MATSSELQLVISAKDEASAKLKGVSSSVSGLSKAGGVLASGMKMAGLAIAAVGTAAVAFGISSVKAYAAAELAQKRFETGLKNIAKASDEEIAALRKQQMALQSVTMFEDDAIASAQGFLATFQLTTKQIEKITPDLLDMAEGLRKVTGGTVDLEGASNMLGKAMQLGTLSVLRRVGITIPGTTKAMQDLYEEKFKMADMDKRLAMLGDMLKGNFEGQAKAAGTTLAGQIQIAKNQFGNFKENIGKFIAGEGTDYLDWLVKATAYLQAMDIQSVANNAVSAWQNLTQKVRDFFQETNVVWVFIRDFLQPIWISLRDTFIKAWTDIVAAIQPIKPELEIIAKYFGVLILGAIMALILGISTAIEFIVKVITGLIQIFSGVVTFLEGLFQTFFSALLGDSKGVDDGLRKMWEGFVTFLKGIAGVLFAPFYKAFDSLKGAWEKLVQGIKELWNSTIGGKGFSIPDWVPEIGGKSYKIPRLALGGAVSAGQSYIVGENRPEVFVPSQSGNIRQTDQMGGREVNINFNNVSVRNDNDLDSIVRAVRNAINKEQEFYKIGAM